jgi:hypothetical protein
MVNVSGSRSAVADAQRDMPRETQLDDEKIGMEEEVRIEANTITHPLRRRLLKIAFTSTEADTYVRSVILDTYVRQSGHGHLFASF